jgi:transcriptional repressor NrdR
MKCPFCGAADTSVLESRTVEDGVSIRRRRECGKCDKRFTTTEEVKRSFLDITDQVEMEMLRSDKQEIPTRVIGNAVLKRLKKVDKVAWLRFASVYLEFEDLGDFEKLI